MNNIFITKEDIYALEKKIERLLSIVTDAGIQPTQKFYTTKQLANALSVSVKTVSNWREERLIEYCKVNNTIFYTEKAIQCFLAAHTIKRKNTITNRINSIGYGQGK